MIDLNITFFFQLVNFLVTLVVLNAILIRPVRDIIRQRRDKMSGLLGESEQFAGQADTKLKNYEATLVKARAEATAERDKARAEGVAREQVILADAGRQAQDYLEKSRQEVAAQVKTAMDALKGQVDALAAKATAKVLG
ncbi:ATP synthase subunit b [anaerobic digester metagenome]|uniref:ATP synthase F0 subunit B n=1 Tax=Nitratidesulfovibrio liaohensis TaxID=2604158 RepID=UPI00142492D8|nr:ATP synthase F0 subunit B [Nitratidesulfovibrio liaohensis]NHZ47309.1 ATP synthase F0 subunit B [Nitratidesulfovibrio liaohensis]